MKRSDINGSAGYFDKYINLVDDIDLMDALTESANAIKNINIEKWLAIGKKVYEPGKWTINEIIQHITDWERIFCYRILIYSRSESQQLPGHDEEKLALQTNANNRTLEDLLNELLVVRNSTIELYKSFTESDLVKKGIFWKYELSVLAMGFNLIGHQVHYFNIIKERYN